MNDSPQTAPEDLESVWEAAQALGISVATIYSWIRQGRVAMYPGLHYRLVSRAAVQALAPSPDPGAPADAVAIYEAIRHTGVSRKHIVAWVTQGWLASWQGRFGRLVLVEDVQALAQQNAVSAPAAEDSMPLPPDALLIREVVRLSGVTKGRIYTWINQGRIPAWPGTRGGQRVRLADVVAQAAQYDRVLPRRKPRGAP